MSTGSARTAPGAMSRRYDSGDNHRWAAHSSAQAHYPPPPPPPTNASASSAQQQPSSGHYYNSGGAMQGPPNQHQNTGANKNNNSAPDRSHEGLPEVPTHFPQLEAMSVAALQSLSDDTAQIEAFVNDHVFQIHTDKVVGSLRTEIERLELELKKHKEEDSNENADEQHEQEEQELQSKIDELTKEIAKLQKVQDDWRKKNSRSKLIERLNDAIRESEQLSIQLETNMLSKNMDFTDFVREYTACRKLYHERRQKVEQLKFEEYHSVDNDYFGR